MADTFVLQIEALLRRVRTLGPQRLGELPPVDRKIVYLDLGLHTEAVQVQLVSDWFRRWPKFSIYAFEAHPGYAETCRQRFANDNRIHIFNFALVGPNHEGNTVTLHLTGGSGVGNSLFAAKGEKTISVPAVRLSEFLRQHEIISPDTIVILRMNIEGAETYVIEDLIDAGMAGLIDGYYGMWDDLFKIDPKLDVTFRKRLERERVRSFPFNDRDTEALAGPRRKNIIQYDMITSIYSGLSRKVAKSAASTVPVQLMAE